MSEKEEGMKREKKRKGEERNEREIQRLKEKERRKTILHKIQAKTTKSRRLLSSCRKS